MSWANDFIGKLEDVAKAYLVASKQGGNLAAFTEGQILAGIDDASVNLPRIVCVCDSAVSAEIYDGNWKGDLQITVIASADDTTRAQFREMCGEVFAHFMQSVADNLANLSSATIEFTAQSVKPRRIEKHLIATANDTQWEQSLFLEVEGCGSVIG